MKRLIIIMCGIVLSLLAWGGVHRYVDHSVLRDGKIIKIRVSETGVHCLPYDTLQAWGLQPEKVRILGYGGNMLSENFTLAKWDDVPSVAFYMHKGADGVFGRGDYLLFYAQGPVKWAYEDGRWYHTQNPYSNFGYYFLSDSAGEQRLITQSEELDGTNAYDVDWYVDYRVHERDSFNLIDLSGVSGGGREFYGETFQGNRKQLVVNFDTKDVLLDKTITCMVRVAAASQEGAKFEVAIADSRKSVVVKQLNVSDHYTKAQHDSILLLVKPTTTSAQKVNLKFSDPTGNAIGYLNYIELNVPCSLVMRDKVLAISNPSYLSQRQNTRFNLSGATDDTQVWRVTDGVNIEQMPTQRANGLLQWVGSNAKVEKYVAVNVNVAKWKIPRKVGVIENQDLHALSNIDYVIISPNEFVEAATRLAKKHEEVDHLTWAVVTDEQVYNEFSSGTPDVSAYRWLMKMLYDRANGNAVQAPKYLLLMGNASYDNRKLLQSSGVSKLLVYEARNSTVETHAYGTDDYCGFLEDNAGVDIILGRFNDANGIMNIGVGRLPVRTEQQANQVVDKICTYMDDQLLGKWKSQLCFLADDGDHGSHVQTAEAGAIKVATKAPDLALSKIYLDAYTQEVNASGETYPLAKNQFYNMLDNGVLFMNYSGHGGYNNITSEVIMRTRDIQNMTNTRQGFWFLATCSFSHFDGYIPSAAEEALLNPHGGAIGVLSACRTVYVAQNTVFNRNFCDALFDHDQAFNYNTTLGEATRLAKNNSGRDVNKLAYVLLGDPALRLNYPTDYRIQTTSQLDTLKALTIQTVKGYVMTAEGDTASWYNGLLDMTVWDKMQEMSTRDNDEKEEDKKVKLKFNDYPNKLFAGQTQVKDGKFEITFMVPKDIRYNYGNGRILYYAQDTVTGEEGVGRFEDFVVGGTSTVEIMDTIGPDLQLYLNNPAFANGGKTYESPRFYAKIYDESGINTVGSGIGHDLLLIIDNDPENMHVLNDYFSTQNNSYQQGTVSYKIPEMTEGAHSLTFRAWDLLNNSSTATMDFQVVKGLDPTIYQVLSYPNPVACNGVLNFRIECDQPEGVLQTIIRMYDLSGKLVYEYNQRGIDDIHWDMNKVNAQSGIYVYQVIIKTPTSDNVSKAGKIIVF